MALPASGVISVSSIVSFYNTNSGSTPITLSNVSLRGLAALLWANDPDAGHAGGMTSSAASSGPVTLGTNFYSWQARKSTALALPQYMTVGLVYDGAIPGTMYPQWRMDFYPAGKGTCNATTSFGPAPGTSAGFTTPGQTLSGTVTSAYGGPSWSYTITAGTYYNNGVGGAGYPPACVYPVYV